LFRGLRGELKPDFRHDLTEDTIPIKVNLTDGNGEERIRDWRFPSSPTANSLLGSR
jgi:hypothetical protein